MKEKIQFWIQRINPKSLKFIIPLILIILIPLILLIISFYPKKNQLKSKPQWQTYEKQVKEGTIIPASKILEISLTASGSALSITSITQKNGYIPKALSTSGNYFIETNDSKGKVVYRQSFKIPNQFNYDNVDSSGKLSGGTVNQPNVVFALTIPWISKTSRIRIVDNKGQEITSSSLSSVKVVDNKPHFNSIRSDEFIHPPAQKLNFNFLSLVYADTSKKTLNVTLIGNNYHDINAYHNDVNRFTQEFLKFEPFATRASQITFNSVDNLSDLECTPKGQTQDNRYVTCNGQVIIQKLNDAGVPYDQVAVINNTDNYGGSGGGSGGPISVQYNGIYGPYLFVHEFAHSFGRLTEEYAITGDGAVDRAFDNQVHNLDDASDGNCYGGQPPARQWDGLGVSDSDYRTGCGNPETFNWYAPSQTSIMHTLEEDSRFFNKVSQKMISKRMDVILSGGSNDKTYYVPRDIYAINRRGASGKTEVHQLSASSSFTDFSLHAVTALGPTDSKQWTFALGFYDNDNITDLYAINRNGASGKTEVHILSGASDFKDLILQTPTALDSTQDSRWDFVGGNFDGDNKTDIYAINRKGASGKTEVHVLSGSNDFKEFSLHAVSGLGPTDTNQWSFYAAGSKGGGSFGPAHDSLFGINRRGGSGKSEVHILNARSNFSEFNFHGVLPLGPTDNADWVFAGGAFDDKDTFVDLYAINRNGGSGKTDVHVATDADKFAKFYMETPTALGPAGDQWSFANAQDFVSSAGPKPTDPVNPTQPINPTAGPTNGPQPSSFPTDTPIKPTKPVQPFPTFVCAGSKDSICNPTGTITPRPTNTQNPTITQVPGVTIEPIISPVITPTPDNDCLDPRSTPEKINDWVKGFLKKIGDYIQLIMGNPQAQRPAPPQPCVKG